MIAEIGTHPKDGKPLLLVETQDEWRIWLEGNHDDSGGVWLVSWKKATGKPFVPFMDAVDEALCFGWVDSKINKLDDEAAKSFFENFPDSSKKNILWWIKSARRPKTRATRISKTVGLAAQNRMANHPAGRDKGPTRTQR